MFKENRRASGVRIFIYIYTVRETRIRQVNWACAKRFSFIGRENPTTTVLQVKLPIKMNLFPHMRNRLYGFKCSSRYRYIRVVTRPPHSTTSIISSVITQSSRRYAKINLFIKLHISVCVLLHSQWLQMLERNTIIHPLTWPAQYIFTYVTIRPIANEKKRYFPVIKRKSNSFLDHSDNFLYLSLLVIANLESHAQTLAASGHRY